MLQQPREKREEKRLVPDPSTTVSYTYTQSSNGGVSLVLGGAEMHVAEPIFVLAGPNVIRVLRAYSEGGMTDQLCY